MRQYTDFYIDGAWVSPSGVKTSEVINPATEEVAGVISLGRSEHVDQAVAAAGRAFDSFGVSPLEERIALLERVLAVFERRIEDVAAAITEEMGAPRKLAREAQAAIGYYHLKTGIEVLRQFQFEEVRGSTKIRREPVGVCGLITPWNWPINQMTCKIVPALAVGCTMVLKPSELAPFSAHVLAEILHEAGVPAGVFNLVDGTGAEVGAAMSAHPDIDMISFTGSTRAGVEVARAAAATVKRVAQELGGKSANIILDDVELEPAVVRSVQRMFMNSGQSCDAPSRMLVPAALHDQACAIAKATAEAAEQAVGDPLREETLLGPLANASQFEKVQRLIQVGINEGATLVAGGPGRPQGLDRGHFVRPTIFGNVRNDMTIAREEIFGPVLSILPYETEAEAVRIANDTVYGLSGYVQSGDLERARRIADQLRTGNVNINGAGPDFLAPFGGYKQSGNGREWGDHAFGEFLETKAVIGYEAA